MSSSTPLADGSNYVACNNLGENNFEDFSMQRSIFTIIRRALAATDLLATFLASSDEEEENDTGTINNSKTNNEKGFSNQHKLNETSTLLYLQKILSAIVLIAESQRIDLEHVVRHRLNSLAFEKQMLNGSFSDYSEFFLFLKGHTGYCDNNPENISSHYDEKSEGNNSNKTNSNKNSNDFDYIPKSLGVNDVKSKIMDQGINVVPQCATDDVMSYNKTGNVENIKNDAISSSDHLDENHYNDGDMNSKTFFQSRQEREVKKNEENVVSSFTSKALFSTLLPSHIPIKQQYKKKNDFLVCKNDMSCSTPGLQQTELTDKSGEYGMCSQSHQQQISDEVIAMTDVVFGEVNSEQVVKSSPMTYTSHLCGTFDGGTCDERKEKGKKKKKRKEKRDNNNNNNNNNDKKNGFKVKYNKPESLKSDSCSVHVATVLDDEEGDDVRKIKHKKSKKERDADFFSATININDNDDDDDDDDDLCTEKTTTVDQDKQNIGHFSAKEAITSLPVDLLPNIILEKKKHLLNSNVESCSDFISVNENEKKVKFNKFHKDLLSFEGLTSNDNKNMSSLSFSGVVPAVAAAPTVTVSTSDNEITTFLMPLQSLSICDIEINNIKKNDDNLSLCLPRNFDSKQNYKRDSSPLRFSLSMDDDSYVNEKNYIESKTDVVVPVFYTEDNVCIDNTTVDVNIPSTDTKKNCATESLHSSVQKFQHLQQKKTEKKKKSKQNLNLHKISNFTTEVSSFLSNNKLSCSLVCKDKLINVHNNNNNNNNNVDSGDMSTTDNCDDKLQESFNKLHQSCEENKSKGETEKNNKNENKQNEEFKKKKDVDVLIRTSIKSKRKIDKDKIVCKKKAALVDLIKLPTKNDSEKVINIITSHPMMSEFSLSNKHTTMPTQSCNNCCVVYNSDNSGDNSNKSGNNNNNNNNNNNADRNIQILEKNEHDCVNSNNVVNNLQIEFMRISQETQQISSSIGKVSSFSENMNYLTYMPYGLCLLQKLIHELEVERIKR